MNDLISRSALLEALENEKIRLAVDKVKMFALIESAPAVDAVPVVRCRECEHKHAISCEGIVLCTYHGKMIQMKSSDFCSYGERSPDV